MQSFHLKKHKHTVLNLHISNSLHEQVFKVEALKIQEPIICHSSNSLLLDQLNFPVKKNHTQDDK